MSKWEIWKKFCCLGKKKDGPPSLEDGDHLVVMTSRLKHEKSSGCAGYTPIPMTVLCPELWVVDRALVWKMGVECGLTRDKGNQWTISGGWWSSVGCLGTSLVEVVSEEFILDTWVAVRGKKQRERKYRCSQRGNYMGKHSSQEAGPAKDAGSVPGPLAGLAAGTGNLGSAQGGS